MMNIIIAAYLQWKLEDSGSCVFVKNHNIVYESINFCFYLPAANVNE